MRRGGDLSRRRFRGHDVPKPLAFHLARERTFTTSGAAVVRPQDMADAVMLDRRAAKR